jgi:hypothetical protein
MSISVDINGVVKEIKDVETFASGFSKRAVIVEQVGEKYNDVFSLEFLKDKAEEAGSLNVGDAYKFSCNVNSRYWEQGDKYFTGISCWRTGSVDESVEQVAAEKSEEESDLPF